MEKSAKQGNRNVSKFEDGTLEGTEKPLEFTQLKQMYDNTVQQFIELLKDIDPEISSKLLNTSQVPKTPPLTSSLPPKTIELSSEGSDEDSATESTDKADYKALHERLSSQDPNRLSFTNRGSLPEHLSQLFDDNSDGESTISIVERAYAPHKTQFSPLAPFLLDLAANAILPTIADAAKSYFQDTLEDKKKDPQQANESQKTTGQGVQQSPYSTQNQTVYPPPNYFQPQTTLGQGVPAGPYPAYPQSNYQPNIAPGQTSLGPQRPPQGPYQPQTPFGQGPPPRNSYGFYPTQNPPGTGGPAGYPQGPYQPQTPPHLGIPTGYPQGPPGLPKPPQQGPYQPQPPPGQGAPTGYPQGPYQPQKTQGQGPPFSPGYPRISQQSQFPPPANANASKPATASSAPFGQYPRPTKSGNPSPSPALTRSSPPRQEVPTEYSQGPYQPKTPPDQGVPTGYPQDPLGIPKRPQQGPYQPQTPPGQMPPGSQKGPQGPSQPQTPPGQGVPTGYPQGPLGIPKPPQQGPYQPQTPPGQMPPGSQKGPQGPSQPQTPPGQGVPTGYPQGPLGIPKPPQQGPYQQQYQPGQGVPTGYPQDPYYPQNPQGQGVRTENPQGPYQPQYPLGQIPLGYQDQPQTPPGQGPPISPGYSQDPNQGLNVHPIDPQGPYQPQSLPQQPGLEYPPPTTPSGSPPSDSVNAKVVTVGADATAISGPVGQFPPPSSSPSSPNSSSPSQLSTPSTPGRSPIATRSVPSSPPPENVITGSKMPPDVKVTEQHKESKALDKLEGEVLKSLKDIDDQINVILNKLEQK